WFTLDALIWSRGEYFVPPASPPYQRHSPLTAPRCASAVHIPRIRKQKSPKQSVLRLIRDIGPLPRNYMLRDGLLRRHEWNSKRLAKAQSPPYSSDSYSPNPDSRDVRSKSCISSSGIVLML